MFAPTFGFASLPPKGALAPWGGPAALKVFAPTFGFASAAGLVAHRGCGVGAA